MNKTEKIFQDLRIRIENGEFSIGSRFPSEYILADEYRISKNTANQAVSMLENCGYVQRGIRGSGTKVLSHRVFPIGIITFCTPFSIYNARILNGVQRTAMSREYAVVVLFGNSDELRLQLEKMNRSKIKGIISTESPALLNPDHAFHFISVDRDAADLDGQICSVNSDNRRGAYELMREILRRGHHEIAIFCGGHETQERAERLQGFCDSMRESNIRDTRKRIFRSDSGNISDTELVLKNILCKFPKTTLIACDGDDSAQTLLMAARNLRISMPGEIALTSYGNTLLVNTPCASVEQHPEQIGARACGKLIDLIESERAYAGMHQELIIPQVVNSEFIPDLSMLR